MPAATPAAKIGADDLRPSMGLEIELAIFAHGMPVGLKSPLPGMVVARAAQTLACLPRFGRAGLFTSAGLLYPEMHRLLEVASWPARDLPSVLRLEDAVLLQARGLLVGLDSGQRHHMVCYPDDAGGTPMQLMTAPPEDEPVSRSMGTHINVVIPAGAQAMTETTIALCCALPAITGPGGFVRRGSSGLEFWRDPRSAHVSQRLAACAHDALRPVLKMTDDPRRLQVVSLGYSASRRDRTIKYGLLLLLGCHAAAQLPTPRFKVDNIAAALQAAADRRIPVVRNRRHIEVTRAELLTMLLDEVLEPAARTGIGAAAQCDAAVELARRVLALQQRGADAGEIARQVPMGWAIKQHVFATELARTGVRLPLGDAPRDVAPAPVPEGTAKLLRQMAALSVLEACVLHDDVRRLLLAQVDDAAWRYDDIYGRDPEAVAAVREQRMPRGAIPPSSAICSALRRRTEVAADSVANPDTHSDANPETEPTPVVAADWGGVRRFDRPADALRPQRRRPHDSLLAEARAMIERMRRPRQP